MGKREGGERERERGKTGGRIMVGGVAEARRPEISKT